MSLSQLLLVYYDFTIKKAKTAKNILNKKASTADILAISIFTSIISVL